MEIKYIIGEGADGEGNGEGYALFSVDVTPLGGGVNWITSGTLERVIEIKEMLESNHRPK